MLDSASELVIQVPYNITLLALAPPLFMLTDATAMALDTGILSFTTGAVSVAALLAVAFALSARAEALSWYEWDRDPELDRFYCRGRGCSVYEKVGFKHGYNKSTV